MPGFLFAERYIDKFMLTSTWLDGITRLDCFTAFFYSCLLMFVVGLSFWNETMFDDSDYEQLYWG